MSRLFLSQNEDGNAWTGIGQGAAVNIHYLIAPGSIDDVMWSTLERKVHQIMSRDVITLKVTDTMVRAIGLFNQHKISCLPVIDEFDKPVGIVSWRDIFRYFGASVEKRR